MFGRTPHWSRDSRTFLGCFISLLHQTSVASETPTRVRYVVLSVACSLAVLTYVQRQGFIAATPEIKSELALNDSQMGYFVAVWLVAYGIFQVPGGLIGDRIGPRQLITLLVLGWSL